MPVQGTSELCAGKSPCCEAPPAWVPQSYFAASWYKFLGSNCCCLARTERVTHTSYQKG